MPYTIKKFNGQTLTVIQDGSVDSISTDLNLPGKNYAGYGKSLNESLVYLLENFANSVEPPNKIAGQLWFDTSVKKIKVFNGVNFKPLSSIEYGVSSPSGQLTGDMWFNTTTNQLFVYDGSVHKLIGPLLTNPNAASLINKVLIDTGGNQRTILEAVFEDSTIAIFSKDEFDIKQDQTPVSGFSKIFKGITLPSRTVYPNVKFGGVAKTSESLLVNNVEVPAVNFVQNIGTGSQIMNTSLSLRVEPTINSSGTFTSLRGLFLGGSDNLFIGYNAGTGYINNTTGSQVSIGVTDNNSLIKVMTVDNLSSYPNQDSTIDIGKTTNKWKNVYANNFYAVDSPLLASNNSAFHGRVDGTTVSATTGFFGKLTGNVVGDIEKSNGDKVLTITGLKPVLTGDVVGSVKGNIINIQAEVNQQLAVDTNSATTVFRGTLQGNATSATGVKLGSTVYPAFVTSVDPLDTAYNNTVAVRDSAGSISAVTFKGVALTAEAILDTNGIARYASVSKTGYTVVVRDSDGSINVGDIRGTATNADKLRDLIPSIENTPSTIVVRDTAGDIKVSTVYGLATSAQYADLAEKYLPDAEYEPGTVVMIGGEKEITACEWGKRAIGVISTNPAFMMNKDLEGGVYVALKGRVPVKVIGRIKKGEDLIAANNGMAMMAVPHANRVFAVALETSDDEGPKVIEALIL